MQDNDSPQKPTKSTSNWKIPWLLISWLCAAVFILGVGACLLVSFLNREGLTSVTVTAIDASAEPHDKTLPFLNEKEDALPDYKLIIYHSDGTELNLGTRPNTSAASGITWQLPEPIGVKTITSIDLQEEDKLSNDGIVALNYPGQSITVGNYQFSFTTQNSFSVGLNYFFYTTAIGKVILMVFGLVLLLILLSAIAGAF